MNVTFTGFKRVRRRSSRSVANYTGLSFENRGLRG